jgi:NAD(P) transhydrogenase subunit alpha
MRIAVAREVDPAEARVAATPDTVKKLKGLGAEVAVEPLLVGFLPS